MLRQQTRPKSQPPIQFSGNNNNTNSNSNSNNSSNEQETNNNNNNNGELSAVKKLALIESNLSLSSSASSSSGGSLASSSLSISSTASSTNSTSTVLAALSHLQQQQQQQTIGDKQAANCSQSATTSTQRAKSMIARYAAPSAGATSQRRSLQHHTLKASHGNGNSTSSEDDENDSIESAHQMSSSSSTSSACESSSSGLSSMNSSAVSSSTSHFVHSAPKPISEQSIEQEVTRCLGDLVNSVSQNVDNQTFEETVAEYQAFKLHQVILAQTNCHTTSGSSDEDTEITRQLSTSAKRVGQNPLKSKLRFVYEFDIERSQVEETYAILHLARQHLSNLVQNQPASSRSTGWLGGVSEAELAIEWQQDQASNQVYFTQILDCLMDGQLIVWLLDRQNPSPSEMGGAASQLTVVDPAEESRRQISELETTLDDIAMALDEPIESCNIDKIKQATGSSSSSNVVALVWLCSSESEAVELADTYKSLRFNMVVEANDIVPAAASLELKKSEYPKQETSGRDVCLPDDSMDVIAAAAVVGETADNKRDLAYNYREEDITNDLNASAQQVKPQAAKTAVNHRQQVVPVAAPTTTKSSNGQPRAEKTPVRVSASRGDTKSISSIDEAARNRKLADEPRASEMTTSDGKATAVQTKQRRFVSSSTSSSNDSASGKQSSSSSKFQAKVGASQLKKSLSGLDLSSTGSLNGQQQQAPSLSLAGYYRSVASRMLSNSSSKIKSLKDEMSSKLNSGKSSASLAANVASSSSGGGGGNKRMSIQATSIRSVGSACDLSSIGKTSEQNQVSGQSVAKKSDETANRCSAKVEHQVVTPTVKPRTSILKKQQPTTTTTTSGNNGNLQQPVARATRASSKFIESSSSSAYKKSTSESNKLCAGDSLRPPTKSILKNSKSLSNIAASSQASSSSHLRSRRNSKLVSSETRSADSSDQEDESSSASLHEKRNLTSSSLSAGHGGDRLAVSATPKRIYARESDAQSQRRRSTYSLSGDKIRQQQQQQPVAVVVVGDKSNDKSKVESDAIVELDNREVDEEREAREQAFERLRQRASCYDITRLMSKNGLHNQLSKLRAGSTASVAISSASKSRQRRPALLLDADSASNDEKRAIDNENVDHKSTTAIIKVKQPKTYSQDSDGTVRAKVSAAAQQSNSSVVDIDWSGQQADEQDNKSSVITSSAKSLGERCEFDPRSLRRNSVVASQSVEGISSESLSRRKSMSSLKLLSLKREEDQNSEASRLDSRGQASLDIAKVSSSVGSSSSRQQAKPLKTILKQRAPTSAEATVSGHRQPADTVVASSGSSNDDDEDEDEDTEVPSSEDDDDEELTETDEPKLKLKSKRSNKKAEREQEVEQTKVALSKSGPFSLLRQSFSQKSLTSMLKFSSRASLRVKAPVGQDASGAMANQASDKSIGISAAEANLLAAKQLKQQAQKLKEQQKREQQQQMQIQLQQQQQQQQMQMPMVDAATSMMLAVQYNQQQQYQRQQQQHHHQQQQQMLYAQQYAVAARSHMFDATSVHMQHQMLIQRHHHQQQQQHQMANYMASYMAQQMVPPVAPMSMGSLAPPQVPPMYLQPPVVPMVPAVAGGGQAPQQMGRKSILKSANGSSYGGQQQQQLIPMSVNHHSSFNIVYTGSPAASAVNGAHQHLQYQQPAYQKPDQHHGSSSSSSSIQSAKSASSASTKSSLGASMRKTVKSILINRSPFSANHAVSELPNGDSGKANEQPKQIKLKSALKSSSSVSRELVLNSEGSDGDGSSSDSTVTNSLESPSNLDQKPYVPKSVLKKPANSMQQQKASPSSSSESSSYASSSSSSGSPPARQSDQYGKGQRPMSTCYVSNDKAQGPTSLSRNMAYRQSVRACDSDLRASKRKIANSTGRKNVTFSTKLTSIL